MKLRYLIGIILLYYKRMKIFNENAYKNSIKNKKGCIN